MFDKQMLKEGKAGQHNTLTITVEHRRIAEEVVSKIGEYEIGKLRTVEVVDKTDKESQKALKKIDEVFKEAKEKR